MLFNDVRYNHYNLINRTGPNKWSTDWHKFAGIHSAFNFEETFRFTNDDKLEWLRDHWHYSLYISIVYIVIVWILDNLMKLRHSPFNLRHPLAIWSAALALFSIFGTIKCLPEFIDILWTTGITASFCDSSYYEDIRLNFWYWIFVISKVFELRDTLFIILRKQKSIRLHWIHHCLTLCFSWYVYPDVPATARWMVNMNFVVHSMMYSYYALKALRFFIPKTIAKFITISQILQMIFGFYINARAFQFKIMGVPCDLSPSVATTGLMLYSIFFILFVNFFVKSYLIKPMGSIKKRKSRNFSDNNNNYSRDKNI